MKVMSFNVLCGNWGKRKVMVRDTIRKFDPDTFGIQEAHYRWMNYLCKELTDYDYVGVGRDNGKRLGEFSPVFYKKDKFEVVDTGNFWLSETPEKPSKGWDGACIRICSYAVLKNKETGKKFAHFNTHLDHIGPVAQSEGAKIIAERADTYTGLPTVVTGDFNVTPDSGAYKTITAAGFEDARFLTDKTDSEGTYHGFGRCSDMIDFIFVKNGITVKNFRTVTDLIDGKFPSDHYPVTAEIEL